MNVALTPLPLPQVTPIARTYALGRYTMSLSTTARAASTVLGTTQDTGITTGSRGGRLDTVMVQLECNVSAATLGIILFQGAPVTPYADNGSILPMQLADVPNVVCYLSFGYTPLAQPAPLAVSIVNQGIILPPSMTLYAVLVTETALSLFNLSPNVFVQLGYSYDG